jgi:hypothetical protein
VYLTWYWYEAIIQSAEPGPFVDAVSRWQTAVAERIADLGAIWMLLPMAVVIVSALISVYQRVEKDDVKK